MRTSVCAPSTVTPSCPWLQDHASAAAEARQREEALSADAAEAHAALSAAEGRAAEQAPLLRDLTDLTHHQKHRLKVRAQGSQG